MFLNGDFKEEIVVRQLEGFTDKNHPNMVSKLQKSLFVLKQSAQDWNKTIEESLKELGYTQNDTDPCIYHKRFIKNNQKGILIIAEYVDDLLIVSNNTDALQLEKKRLGECFKMEDEGEAHYILGIWIMRNRKERLLTINLHALISSLLKRFGMEDCKPVATPLEPGVNIGKHNDDEIVVKLKEFQSFNGSLCYAMIGTRSDISAAVGVLIGNTC